MNEDAVVNAPNQCPVCSADLVVTRLHCRECGTEIAGAYRLGRLASLREPHASVIELFLRVRGNVKEMERELGLSYPTVRARLEEALAAAGMFREGHSPPDEGAAERSAILDQLEAGDISASEATVMLKELKTRRGQ